MAEQNIDTREQLAKLANVSHGTIAKVEAIESKATPQQKEQLKSGTNSINKIHAEIKIRAERRAGEMLRETERNTGGQAEHKSYQSHDVTSTPKLSDIGVTKIQSSPENITKKQSYYVQTISRNPVEVLTIIGQIS